MYSTLYSQIISDTMKLYKIISGKKNHIYKLVISSHQKTNNITSYFCYNITNNVIYNCCKDILSKKIIEIDLVNHDTNINKLIAIPSSRFISPL